MLQVMFTFYGEVGAVARLLLPPDKVCLLTKSVSGTDKQSTQSPHCRNAAAERFNQTAAAPLR